MKQLIVLAPLGLGLVAGAHARPFCDAARAGVERFARTQGLTVEVRCRDDIAKRPPVEATLIALEVPASQAPRGGPTTWPVRVKLPAARGYVRQVPLTVTWTAPAWVAVRDLDAGAELRQGDLEVALRRWPEGWPVQAADRRAQPGGRLRTGLRAGDMLAAAALLAADGLVRGDRVTAVLTQGAMEIRLPARLLAPARVGQVARAQASGRTAPLEGQMVDAQTLVVVGE